MKTAKETPKQNVTDHMAKLIQECVQLSRMWELETILFEMLATFTEDDYALWADPQFGSDLERAIRADLFFRDEYSKSKPLDSQVVSKIEWLDKAFLAAQETRKFQVAFTKFLAKNPIPDSMVLTRLGYEGDEEEGLGSLHTDEIFVVDKRFW